MNPDVYCAVLAAGQSSRFGSTKQLATIAGDTLVARAAANAEAACPGRSLLVAGHDANRVITASRGHCRGTAINGNYRDGIGTSIACAAAALQHVADGLMITLADQPLVSAEHLKNLVATFRANPDIAVASRYASTLGPPAIFSKTAFPELMSLQGDKGAKQLLQTMDCIEVSFEGAATDIDRPEDLTSMS